MSKNLYQVVVVMLAISFAAAAQAQVINAPMPQTNQAVQQTAATAPGAAVEESAGSGIPLPKITMPKITMPKITMPNMDSITGPVKSGFGKVSAGTKKAWEGTKEMFSFGRDKTTRVASRPTQKKPSLWQKLIVRESKPQVPQTVGEFMSQPRLDP